MKMLYQAILYLERFLLYIEGDRGVLKNSLSSPHFENTHLKIQPFSRVQQQAAVSSLKIGEVKIWRRINRIWAAIA